MGLFDNIDNSQKKALREIRRITAKMRTCWDKEYLFDLYCQADDIWNDEFPFQAEQLGDNWSVTKLYNDLARKLKNHGQVTINIFDCNVTINTATS